jgi:hypothetical protein
MAETQNGRAVVWGITNNGTAIAIEGYASILESVKIVHKYETETIKNEVNHDVSLIATNPHKEVDIMFVPAAATIGDAYGQAIFIPPNAEVTLKGFKIDPGPGQGTGAPDFNGKWVRVGDMTLTLSHKEAKMDLKIRQYDDDTINSTICKTVSS